MTNKHKPDAEDQAPEQDPNIEEVTAETEQDTASELDADDSQVETAADDEIEQLKAQLAEAKDQVVRAAADSQNTRRRAEKDVEGARRYALEKFSADLLPVVDNLERALASVEGDDDALKPIIEGVELTLKSFIDVLAKYKVEQINPEGEPFDPQLHQAVGMVPNPDVEPNSVLHVAQKGYSLNGRVIRAAMVMVAKAPE
ncbi:MAG: molecular chaperone GrpE [Pseudomonadales bacterium]